MLILFGWYNALCCGPSCSTIHGSLKGCKYLKALFFFSQIYKSWDNEIAFQDTCLHGSFLVLVLFMSPTFVRSFTRMVEFPILFSGWCPSDFHYSSLTTWKSIEYLTRLLKIKKILVWYHVAATTSFHSFCHCMWFWVSLAACIQIWGRKRWGTWVLIVI